MILGVIDIGLRSTRFTISEITPDSARALLVRNHGLTVSLDSIDRLSALLLAEAGLAREHGVTRLEVVTGPELRGSRLVRLLNRVATTIGIGPVRIPTRRETAAANFLGVTRPWQTGLEGPVGVAHIGETVAGLAVGQPGMRPDWIGSRPVGASTMARRARFSNPPLPTQIEAAITGASRGFASLSPPPYDRMLVASPVADVIARLCGERIGPDDARRGLNAILGQTGADTAAWFGMEPSLARNLPGMIVGHAALAAGLEMTVEPVGCDLGAGRHWLTVGEVGTGSREPG